MILITAVGQKCYSYSYTVNTCFVAFIILVIRHSSSQVGSYFDIAMLNVFRTNKHETRQSSNASIFLHGRLQHMI